jgi:hypothetical protein
MGEGTSWAAPSSGDSACTALGLSCAAAFTNGQPISCGVVAPLGDALCQ